MNPAPTIGVCGFGRCGSTMLMQMLAAGGIPMAPGSDPASGELPLDAFEALRHGDPADIAGTAVKLLDLPLRSPLPTAAAWRFVWLDRDPVEQARSHIKLLALVDPDIAARTAQPWAFRDLVASYGRDRPRILGILRSVGPTVVLRYEQVLANPRRAVRHLRALAPDIDGIDAAQVVHRRDGRCRPDLATEEAAAATAGARP